MASYLLMLIVLTHNCGLERSLFGRFDDKVHVYGCRSKFDYLIIINLILCAKNVIIIQLIHSSLLLKFKTSHIIKFRSTAKRTHGFEFKAIASRKTNSTRHICRRQSSKCSTEHYFRRATERFLISKKKYVDKIFHQLKQNKMYDFI